MGEGLGHERGTPGKRGDETLDVGIHVVEDGDVGAGGGVGIHRMGEWVVG